MADSPEISALETLKKGYCSPSYVATMEIAERFALELLPGSSIALCGDLGAGKTTFVKGIARGLGILETVKSPSFNICCIYEAPFGLRLVHVDAYRLKGAADFENLLLDEIAPEPKITCIEWPEILGDAFSFDITLKMEITQSGHFIRIV